VQISYLKLHREEKGQKIRFIKKGVIWANFFSNITLTRIGLVLDQSAERGGMFRAKAQVKGVRLLSSSRGWMKWN